MANIGLNADICLYREEVGMFDLTRGETPLMQGFLEDPDYMRRSRGLEMRIVEMTPDEYMAECAKFHNNTIEEEYMMVDPVNVERLKEVVAGGELLPLPYLDYARRGQEGRHRAVLAKQLGYKYIPVMVLYKAED